MKALATLKSSVAPQIKGTRLEPLAKWIWDRVSPPDPEVIANRQKQAYMKQAPVYMEQIMSQVLTKESNRIDVGFDTPRRERSGILGSQTDLN